MVEVEEQGHDRPQPEVHSEGYDGTPDKEQSPYAVELERNIEEHTETVLVTKEIKMKRIVLAALLLASVIYSADKVRVTKSVVPCTTKVALIDTVKVVRTDTTKIFNTFRDTVKLVKSDTVKSSKFDTLRTPKKK